MHYILIKSMNRLRNRTQIPRKTKDIAEIYSLAKLVIPPEVEKVRCWGTLLGTTGNLGRDTVKTNILDCNKKELSICLLLKINANYYLRGEAIHSMKKKKKYVKSSYYGNQASHTCFAPSKAFAATVYTKGFWTAFM